LRQQARGHEGADLDLALAGGVGAAQPFDLLLGGQRAGDACRPSRRPTSRITARGRVGRVHAGFVVRGGRDGGLNGKPDGCLQRLRLPILEIPLIRNQKINFGSLMSPRKGGSAITPCATLT
jgi:hypothetical protein